PAIVVIRSGYYRKHAGQMRRLGDRGEHLRGAHVRCAEHADFAVRVRECRGPFYSVVAVAALIVEWVPVTVGGVAPAHILNDDYIAEPGRSHAELGFAIPFVV